MTRLFRVISWDRTAGVRGGGGGEGGKRVGSPCLSALERTDAGGVRKILAIKGKRAVLSGASGAPGPYCSGETALCNHVDFYGISYEPRDIWEGKERRRTGETVLR